MSRALSELLNASEPSFTNLLRRLEADSGHPDVDVRLVGDIAAKVRVKLRELGLDSTDTNGLELYHSLQVLTASHDEFLAKSVGADDPNDVGDLLPRIVEKIQSLPITKSCWAVKHSVAKRLIKDMTPKKLMKALGYRSVDSMIKREPVDQIYAAAVLTESASWRSRLIAAYKKLRPSDFESRAINLFFNQDHRLDEQTEQFVDDKGSNILTITELGVIVVLPLPVKHMAGISITVMPLLIRQVNELRLLSAYFKLQQVKPNFSTIFTTALTSTENAMLSISGQPIDWTVVHRRYGKKRTGSLPSVFEPYVQVEDLSWQSAEDILYKLEPALKFWEDLDYSAAMFDNRPVPLGLADNALSYCNGLAYGQQSVDNFRRSLSDELYSRYLAEEPIENQIIKQLDSAAEISNISLTDLKGLA